MRERPILFRPDLVRAILSGRKTETRRPVESGRVRLSYIGPGSGDSGDPANYGYETDDGFAVLGNHEPDELRVPCPFGAEGDRLWVRETWAKVPRTAYHHDPSIPHVVSPDGDSWAVYRASWERCAPSRWTPSIHMPRWACRLVLPIAEVRVERLQDITFAGVCAEGFGPGEGASMAWLGVHHRAFSDTWDAVYGKQDGLRWADNPWVWVVRWNFADILTGEAARPEAPHA